MKTSHSIELEDSMHEFLNEMVKKYDLENVGKAVRCLVNYARAESAQEKSIFGKRRCQDC